MRIELQRNGADMVRRNDNGPLGHKSGHHIPPHLRKPIVQIEYDEQDWQILMAVFHDEDTVLANVEIIQNAPPEIQILAAQLINIIKEVM